jgi:uncharacterized protein
MKIRVDEIPKEGLELREEIGSESLSLDLTQQCISFVKPIRVKAHATKTGNEVFVDLSLEAPVEYTCSRCLAKVESVIKKDFSAGYGVKPMDIVELDEDIRQELIIDSPMKALCKPDCKGLCPNCGQNLNVGGCDCDKDKNR